MALRKLKFRRFYSTLNPSSNHFKPNRQLKQSNNTRSRQFCLLVNIAVFKLGSVNKSYGLNYALVANKRIIEAIVIKYRLKRKYNRFGAEPNSRERHRWAAKEY